MSVFSFKIGHSAPSQSRAATQRKHRSTTQNHADIAVIKIVLSTSISEEDDSVKCVGSFISCLRL